MVVETIRGLELGHVTLPIQEVEDGILEHELKPVVRIASKQDIKIIMKIKRKPKEI